MTEREMARKKAAARKARARKQRTRRAVMTIALMLVVSVASIGGTIAWLTDKTENVTNTFSPSNIEIELDESGDVADADGNTTQDFQLIPGKDLEKDPKVYAHSDVDYYVFVKVTEKNWPHDLLESDNVTKKLSYQIADGWTLLPTDDSVSGTVEYVYYKTVAANTSVGSKDVDTGVTTGESVLKSDKVYVSNQLTKEDMATITAAEMPELTFKAYAIQQLKSNGSTFTPAEAWAQVNS